MQWNEKYITLKIHHQKIETNMVHLVGVSISKGYSYIFKFYSQLREKCHNQTNVENRQGFPIDRIQKNIIISITSVGYKLIVIL